ncbi:MAG: SipW-dependent-type signal peptide-containing protein [Minisyncoccales bacterium]
MNKKILTSVSLIALVSLIAIGGTIAYFNDTQTSAGNIIVAGTMNLKIDHLKQTYGIMDCKTCSVEVYSSDGHDMVVEKNGVSIPSYPAVAAWVHSNWLTAAAFDSDNEAKWIWEKNPTQQADTQVNTSYSFQNTFEWMGEINGATLDLALASDNGYVVSLNGHQIGQDSGEFNYSSADHIASIDSSYFIQGTNVLKFVVTNKGVVGSNPQTNPAGLIYKLTINGNCGDDHFKTNCKLWQAKDLVEGDTFFDFDDVKPGDYGTNLISVHVNGNDAWSCFYAKKSDNSVEYISRDLNVVIWNDNQDGIHQANETPLYTGNLVNTSIPLAEKGLPPITGGTTEYIGLAWCFGTQTVNTDGTIDCDGSTVNNDAQGNTLNATLTAYAEQWRNNPDFLCSSTPVAP